MEFTAADIAEYDQQIAATTEILNELISAYLKDVDDVGATEADVNLSQAVYLTMQYSPGIIANLLTVAVAKLAKT